MIQIQTGTEIQTCVQIEIHIKHNFYFHLVTDPSRGVFVNKRIGPSFWPAQSDPALYHGSENITLTFCLKNFPDIHMYIGSPKKLWAKNPMKNIHRGTVF